MLSMSAFIWAAKAGGVPLGSLKKGDKFVWPNASDPTPRVYCGRGWFTYHGKKCRSGVKAAVIKVSQQNA